jgi:beta-N-acetylhexosaminidase
VTLTADQLAGQRIIYGYKGLVPPERLLELVRTGKAAGVFFRGQNVSSAAQLRAAISALKAAADDPRNPVRAPLLLMTDQEGGRIRRLPGGPQLSAKQVGASADPDAAATRAGTQAGTALASVGMNVNLAPVLDVYRSPGDFEDSLARSYSTDTVVVSRLGERFIAAEQSRGVVSVAKHFPGLGAASTRQNTDLRPVTLRVPLGRLRSVDEAAFAGAIDNGVPMVMLSWAVYPALSPRPAGLASEVARGELRDRLGFAGVTVTDALGARALDAYGSTGARAVLAADAGMDLLLCSQSRVAQGDGARRALASALETGTLEAPDFAAAAQRVVDLRYRLLK